jgi:hypothetical protein
MHTDLYVFFISLYFALHVSGAVCTHHQEHQLQSTVIGMRNVYGSLVHTYSCTLQFVLLMMGATTPETSIVNIVK